MAGHGTIDQRPSTMSTPTTPPDPEDSTGKNRDDFERPEFRVVCPFSIPSSPEAASLRIRRNLGHFALYYTHFVWIVLFITLIPQQKVSLILLVIMTYVASLYLLLLRALPPYFHLLHKIIYKSMVLGLIAVATMIELIATEAGLHLVITLAATVPIVLIHAVLLVREDFCVEERTGGDGGGGGGELVSLIDESTAMV
ncbi:hypothetical protein NC651_036344 [Populus alba x Populus x berolinensis]|nr:hypothetical protein NC651_036344 [Populus alba x Populus x berolinensis]